MVPIVASLGAAAVSVLGFAVGRGSRSDPPTTCPRCREALVVAPRCEPLDPTAPLWATTGRWEIPSVGSIFRNRLATADSPLEGLEAVVVSPRDSECTDSCPIALRVVGGHDGTVLLSKIVTTLEPNLKGVMRAPGLTPTTARWFETGVSSLDARKGPGQVERAGDNPLRALFVAMPRPDIGPRAHSVGLALGDLPDPHFDDVAGEAGERDGWLLFVSRLEQNAVPEEPRLWGAVAFVHVEGRSSWRPIPATTPELSLAFGPLWGHYAALPSEIAGVYMDPEGRLFLFGSDLVLHRAPDDEVLRAALSSLLRRA